MLRSTEQKGHVGANLPRGIWEHSGFVCTRRETAARAGALNFWDREGVNGHLTCTCTA